MANHHATIHASNASFTTSMVKDGGIHEERCRMYIWDLERSVSNLKTGICVHSLKVTDQIWKTCCMLHNWLLETDGLDKKFDQDGTPSEWEGPMGHNDIVDFQAFAPVAAVAQALNNAGRMQHFNTSRFGQFLPADMVPVEDYFDDDSNEFDDVMGEVLEMNDETSLNEATNNMDGDVCIVRELDFEYF